MIHIVTVHFNPSLLEFDDHRFCVLFVWSLISSISVCLTGETLYYRLIRLCIARSLMHGAFIPSQEFNVFLGNLVIFNLLLKKVKLFLAYLLYSISAASLRSRGQRLKPMHIWSLLFHTEIALRFLKSMTVFRTSTSEHVYQTFFDKWVNYERNSFDFRPKSYQQARLFEERMLQISWAFYVISLFLCLWFSSYEIIFGLFLYSAKNPDNINTANALPL